MAVSILLGFWGCASAQSLGTPSGEILLGRPLEIVVPARFPTVDGNGDECVHADVFFGDARLKADLVRATVVAGADQQRRIRVETQAPIDEPVVTVSLRAGCRNTITRNYTLLPNYPSETLLAAAAARAAGTTVPAAAPVPLQLATAAAPVAPAPVVRAARAPAIVHAAEAGAAPTRARGARAVRAEAVARGPRLKLEPIELLEPEARTLLRVSTTMLNPQGDAASRAAAAMLWKAINADPQELLRTTAMLQKLETDLAQMRQASTQTRAELLALRRRLDEVQPWYASAPLVQGLLLLVLGAGAAAGVLWWRTRRFGAAASEPWYVPTPEESQGAQPVPASEEVVELPLQRAAATPPRQPAAPPVAVPVPAAKSTEPATPAARDPSLDFELPEPDAAQRRGTDGVLRVETLAATFEEVEFLASLGLRSDAMDVLKSYLQDSTSPAPLAFFELMRLCEAMEDPAALATVRRRYAQAFGVEAPRLEQVTAPLGLEQSPELSARITRAWGSSEALELIEQTLFTVPAPGTMLTLQAGRDLLSLYDLAMARATDAAGPQGANDADAHPLAPWAEVDDPAAAQAAAHALPDAQGGHRFALDVDLSAAPESLPETQDDSHLAPLLAELKAAADIQARAQQQAEQEDAFSAAVASERVPVSRF